MGEKFLQDIKEGKYLTSFCISQEDVDFAKESSKKYYINPNYKKGSIEHRMDSESKGIVFLEDKITEPYDWEALRHKLEIKNNQFSIMSTEMPTEPVPSIVQSVTSGIELRFHKLFKDPKCRIVLKDK